MAEFVVDDVEVDRPGVVHVETGGLSVGDDQPGIADGAVGGCAQRDDHDIEVALGSADAVLGGVDGLDELEVELRGPPTRA